MALPQLDANQTYALLIKNGATEKEAIDLTSIAVPESHFDPNIDNKVAPDYSVGLFQFNFRAGEYNAANPEASTRDGFSVTQLRTSLDAQAQAALGLYRARAAKGVDPTCDTGSWFHCGISKLPGQAAAQAVGQNVDQVLQGLGVTGAGASSGGGGAGGGGSGSGINLGNVAGQPINIPTGLVVGLIGVLLIVIGTLFFAANAQNKIKGAVINTVAQRI